VYPPVVSLAFSVAIKSEMTIATLLDLRGGKLLAIPTAIPQIYVCRLIVQNILMTLLRTSCLDGCPTSHLKKLHMDVPLIDNTKIATNDTITDFHTILFFASLGTKHDDHILDWHFDARTRFMVIEHDDIICVWHRELTEVNHLAAHVTSMDVFNVVFFLIHVERWRAVRMKRQSEFLFFIHLEP
jgi:hypothetical protein